MCREGDPYAGEGWAREQPPVVTSLVSAVTVIGVAFGLAASMANGLFVVAVRKATYEARLMNVMVVILVVNLAVVVPTALVVSYPTYVLTPLAVGSFAAAGVVTVIGGRLLYFRGVQLIGASRAAPIKTVQPLFATLLAVLFLGEQVLPGHLVGILVLFAGVAYLTYEFSQSDATVTSWREVAVGVSYPLGAGLLLGTEPVLVKVGLNAGMHPMVGLAIKLVTGTVLLFTFVGIRPGVIDWQLLRSRRRRWYLLAGLGNTGFLMALYLGLQIAPVSVITPVAQISPVFVIAFSYVLLPDLERLTWGLVAGALLVVAGTVAITVFAA